jgi:integrase
MPRLAKALKAIEVARITTPGWHAVGTVSGLGLSVNGGSRSWTLRVVVEGKRRAIGLGPYPEVGLAAAHDAARALKAQIRKGVDPLLDRRLAVEAKRSAIREAQAALVTFKKAAEDYIDTNRAGWSNPKHAKQWTSTLSKWVYPLIGDRAVAGITTGDVMAVLSQSVAGGTLWSARTETATRVRQRIEAVLDAAKAQGLRTGDNPGAWKGNLASLLPPPSRVSKVEHHAALDWRLMPGFMVELRRQGGMAAQALQFAILCAARSGEVRGAVWSEIDLDAGVWIIPGARMKAGREHRVPLSTQAVALLRALPRTQDRVFPSPTGKEFSDAAMSAVLKRMNVPATAHGFRSSFRDWAAETTGFASEVVEMGLAHAVGNKVEAAYRRGDLFQKRRELSQQWADYLSE